MGACGRVHFGDRPAHDGEAGNGGDGAPGDVLPDVPGPGFDAVSAAMPCNTETEISSLSVGSAADGDYWLAAAPDGDRIVAAYSTVAGASGLELGASGATFTVLDNASELGSIHGDLQVVAAGSNIYFTAKDMSGSGTDIAVAHADLSEGVLNGTATVTVGAPDHSAPLPNGDIALAGVDADGSNGAYIEVDSGGATVGPAHLFAFANAQGASIAPLHGGGFGAVFYSSDGVCEERVLGADLVATQTHTLSGVTCTGMRVAGAPADDELATSWIGSTETVASTYDYNLTPGASGVAISSSIAIPPRMDADIDGFWIAVSDGTQLGATHVSLAGAVAPPVVIGNFGAGGNNFMFDVVDVGGNAFLVWVSSPTQADLYVMRLCAS